MQAIVLANRGDDTGLQCEVEIDCLPVASAVLLPAPVPSRLSSAVPAQEPTICDVFTMQPAFFSVMCSREAKVRAYELYPITRSLQLTHDIPAEMWDSSVKFDQTMKYWKHMFSKYSLVATRDRYPDLIDQFDTRWEIDGLCLFGKRYNALTPVVQMAALVSSKNAKNLVLHTITMICLQYYMMQRERFMEVGPDERGEFSDLDQVYFFLLFPRYDVKKTPYRIPASIASSTWVDRFDFVSFLYNVMCSLLERISQCLPARHRIVPDDCFKWCSDKVFNNLGQLLVTSRFLNMNVEHYANKIRDSIINTTHLPYDSRPIVAEERKKFFPAPEFLHLNALHFKMKPPYDNTATAPDVPNHGSGKNNPLASNRLQLFQSRIPVPYTHFYFSPERSVTRFVVDDIELADTKMSERDAFVCRCEAQDAVLYELAKHMDITLMDKVQTDLKKHAQIFLVNHKLLDLKRETHLPADELNTVRVRHAFVIRNNQLWTNVVANMAQQRRLHSESSPLFISRQAWKWFSSRSRMISLGDDRKPVFSDTVCADSRPRYPSAYVSGACTQHILSSIPYGSFELMAVDAVDRGSTNSFLALQAMQCSGLSEEDAIALLIRDSGLTLSMLISDYKSHYAIVSKAMDEFKEAHRHTQHIKDLLTRSLVKWKDSRFTQTPIPSDILWRGTFVASTMCMFMHEWLAVSEIQVRADTDGEWTEDRTAVYRIAELIGAGQSKVSLPARILNMQFRVGDKTMNWNLFAKFFLEMIEKRICLLSSYFRMHMPGALVRNSDDTTWKEIAALRRNHGVATQFMYKFTKSICSKRMIDDIERICKVSRSSIPQTVISMCNSMYIMLKGVDDLATDQTRRKVIRMLEQICQNPNTRQMPLVGCNETKLIERGVFLLNAHLTTFGSAEEGVRKLLDSIIECVETADLMTVMVRVMHGVSSENLPMVREFESHCISHFHRKGPVRWKNKLGKALARRADTMTD